MIHQTQYISIRLLSHFRNLRAPTHGASSLLGIVLLVIFILQLISGVMIAFSLNCDPMNIPMSRNEEDQEDLYTDDFFWLHERGVDLAFIFIFFHMINKFKLWSITTKQEGAWKTGVLLFLLLHVVTFLGLVLCCTHLSEITLVIAANILHSFTLKKTKIYWWLFPNQELNTDTVLRLMYGHYVSAFIFVVLAIYHSLEMHYDWRDSVFFENQKNSLSWWDDVIKSEILTALWFFVLVNLASKLLYNQSEPLSTELFMWGDVGSTSEIRFLGVTPHWYFRAYMGWLVACPHHYLGLFGLLYFPIALYYQPNIKNTRLPEGEFIQPSRSLVLAGSVAVFAMAILYSVSYLPYGKFYIRLGGNPASLASFAYIFVFLSISFIWIRKVTFKYLNRRVDVLGDLRKATHYRIF